MPASTTARCSGLPDRGANDQSVSDAYDIRFDGGATLSQPMRLEIATTSAPARPQVGEAAMWVDNGRQRLGADFFRADDRKVIALARRAGTVRAAHRRLQASTGDAVARGRGVFLDETFGNEKFFGGTLGLHELLNQLRPAQAVAAGVQVDLAKVPPNLAMNAGSIVEAARTPTLQQAHHGGTGGLGEGRQRQGGAHHARFTAGRPGPGHQDTRSARGGEHGAVLPRR